MNLLRREWADLDSRELRILLDTRIGGPGQYESPAARNVFHLPLALDACRVKLTYRELEIVAVEPGPAFDPDEWRLIADEIESGLLGGTPALARDYTFSSYRVQGWWSGPRSNVHIRPPYDDAPQATVEAAEHPFVLYFPVRRTGVIPVDLHRYRREHRGLSLVLNVLLAGRTNAQLPRPDHFWGTWWAADGSSRVEWVQNSYFAAVGDVFTSTPTQVGEPLLELAPEEYYETVRGLDGRGLRLPADLDDSINHYQRLGKEDHATFDRACFWLDMASRQWPLSLSASFAALVSALEALINHRGRGSAERFRQFVERHAPGSSTAAERQEMYDVRSAVLHGGRLLAMDQGLAFGWDPPTDHEREIQVRLSNLTRVAMRRWLSSRTPRPAVH